jgi:hypothetical protein
MKADEIDFILDYYDYDENECNCTENLWCNYCLGKVNQITADWDSQVIS